MALPLFSLAQTFHHLNNGTGLAQQCIRAIAQDNKGFIWLGGRYGLTRYDGVHFHEYPSKTSDSATICSESVTKLVWNGQNLLWVGTAHGLCSYDPVSDSFTRYRDGILGDNDITCLNKDRGGNLWVGTRSGLFRMDSRHPGEFLKVIRVAGDSASLAETRCMYEDSRGRLWAASAMGLVHLETVADGYRFTLYRGPKGGMSMIWENPHTPGSIWAGSYGSGFLSFDIATRAYRTVLSAAGAKPGLADNTVWAIAPDDRGQVWIGTGDGLTIYDLVSQKFSIFRHKVDENTSLSQNMVFSLFKDSEGSMWVGTYYGGANLSFSHSSDFTLHHGDLSGSGVGDKVVTCIVEDADKKLWMGTDGDGLDCFDRRTGQFTSFRHSELDPGSIGANIVKSICIDRDGNCWVGTRGGGLNLKRGNRFLPVMKDSVFTEIQSILEDREGRFWVAAEDRLRVYTRVGRKLLPNAFDSNLLRSPDITNIYLLYQDKKGDIWMVTTGKIFLLKNGETRITQFASSTDNLFSSNVRSIYEDHRGRMWFGTFKGGLLCVDPSTGDRRRYEAKDGLADNNVVAIGEDDNGQLWLGTDRGLTRFDPQTHLVRNFTSSDELPSGGIFFNAFYKDKNGELFFGAINGLIAFRPADIRFNPDAPAPVFTSLDVYNEPVAVTGAGGILEASMPYQDHLVFKHDQNGFTIHFALLNFIKPDKDRYAYKMEGVDKSWNEVTATSATYTGLPPGDYIFMVKASNNDGVWGPPASMRISIRPPFWKTWWAYGIYALLAAALLFLVMRYLFVQERLKQERSLHKAKLDFFMNISHEIRTQLTLIVGPVEKMLLRHRDEEDRQQLQYVKKNSESLLHLVRELMDFRKAESGNLSLQLMESDIFTFATEIFQRFEPMASERGIRTTVVSPAGVVLISFDPGQMEKVIVNLVSNAYKFTPDGGWIELKLEEKWSSIEIMVIDNGKGIAAANLPRLFTNYFQESNDGVRNNGYGIGLSLSKSIVRLHNGQLTVESKPGVRTCFTVILPKQGPGATIQVQPQLFSPLEPAQLSFVSNNATDRKRDSILLVEDNPELRSFLQSALDDQYHVLHAPDGLEGWEVAIEELPDLIISDVLMPRMDGFTLCGKLKADPRTSHIPTILLSAKSTTADHISGLETGADIYLAKPFSIQVLKLSLRNLLAARERLRHRYASQKALPIRGEAQTLDDQFMKKALEFIELNMEDPEFGVAMLSTHMLMSQPILYKKIKALTDMSVNDFIKSIRLKRAAMLLLEKSHPVYEVMYMVGYNDRKHFAKEFKKMFGVNPSEYGKEPDRHS
jgi:ligand-binding sensor domain-containing protein/signal transduction histidine kinase/DNA-binding response OmpR family regulator